MELTLINVTWGVCSAGARINGRLEASLPPPPPPPAVSTVNIRRWWRGVAPVSRRTRPSSNSSSLDWAVVTHHVAQVAGIVITNGAILTHFLASLPNK